MNLRVWRTVGITAGALVLLSFWTRLPEAWRWPAAGALLLVVAMVLLVSIVVARRGRARHCRPSTPRIRPETPRSPRASTARRGPAGAHPLPVRDAVRLLERIGSRPASDLRR
jgi:hypothetical protein